MELYLLIEILKLVVPTVIAIVSLYYAIKQRSIVKREISKKRYLESALSNLNEVIKSLRDIDVPNIQTLNENYDPYDTWGDVCNDGYSLISDILRASLELKKKKIILEVSYYIRDYGERGKPGSSKHERIIQNFNELDTKWFIDFLGVDRAFSVKSETRITDFERTRLNDIGFSGFEWNIEILKKAAETLSSYEEVYETVSPDSVKKVNQLFEDIAKEIFKTICKPKRIEIDLNKFAEADEILRYLIEEILNFSYIAEENSKVSELISELIRARKELFLKTS